MKPSAAFITFVPLCGVALVIAAFAHAPWTALRIVGLVLALVGFVTLTVARLQLGNSFSVTPQATRLVTHGIYARIRHPVYVFSALGIAGLMLYVDRPMFLLLFAVLVPMQITRARAEERVLVEHFGDEYRVYRARTWF